jgi:UDP-glucuronate 4-epimerase
MRLLVTGVAGFIGFHTAKRFLLEGSEILGIDNLNPYYDVALKEDRLKILHSTKGFQFQHTDISDRRATEQAFERFRPERVVHLAAQAGVRYSVQNPFAYVESNLAGFLNVLEGCRLCGVDHLVYASSSSVYGANSKTPFSVEDSVDHPVSLYAATKKANELMAHAYSHLYRIPATGLRFFTVYGPWGRPDMAPFLFTRAILEGRPIDVYNHGEMKRDFTYIDDAVDGIVRVLAHAPRLSPEGRALSESTVAPYKIYNIGNNQPVSLLHFIKVLEECLGKRAKLNLMPMQAGDVPVTFADIAESIRDVGYAPDTAIEEGLPKFVQWYKSYYAASAGRAGA